MPTSSCPKPGTTQPPMRDGQTWSEWTLPQQHPAIRTQWLSTSLRGKEPAHGVRVEYRYIPQFLEDDTVRWLVARLMQPDASPQTLCWDMDLPQNWYIICAG